MGQPNKMNGSAPSLDSRIAAVLASDVADKTAFVSLLQEAHDALVEAQETITTESENALDIANIDPDASDALVRKAERTIARLEIALPKLRDRIKAIELFEYREAWHADADVVQARGDKAAERLKHYEEFLVWLTAEYAEIDAINAEIHQLHLRAPAGEDRRLLEPELLARGLDHYDAAHPRLRDNLKLPDFIRASTIAFPRDALNEWNARVSEMNQAMTRQLAAKHSFTTGPDWAAGRDLQIQQEEAEHAKRADELRAAETKSKVEYERKVQENDRRRLIGG